MSVLPLACLLAFLFGGIFALLLEEFLYPSGKQQQPRPDRVTIPDQRPHMDWWCAVAHFPDGTTKTYWHWGPCWYDEDGNMVDSQTDGWLRAAEKRHEIQRMGGKCVSP